MCNILGVGEGVLVLGQHAGVDVHQAHLVLAEQLLTTQITYQHFPALFLSNFVHVFYTAQGFRKPWSIINLNDGMENQLQNTICCADRSNTRCYVARFSFQSKVRWC